jgi:hypothetical protein
LHDGTAVIVKIRKPGIREVVEADLRLMQCLADAAAKHIVEAKRYRFPDLMEQFRRYILMELDLAAEARNAERMSANLIRRFGPDHWNVDCHDCRRRAASVWSAYVGRLWFRLGGHRWSLGVNFDSASQVAANCR